jgi:hypothetical protein
MALPGLTSQRLDFFLHFQKFLCVRYFYWGRVAEGKKTRGGLFTAAAVSSVSGAMRTWTV